MPALQRKRQATKDGKWTPDRRGMNLRKRSNITPWVTWIVVTAFLWQCSSANVSENGGVDTTSLSMKKTAEVTPEEQQPVPAEALEESCKAENNTEHADSCGATENDVTAGLEIPNQDTFEETQPEPDNANDNDEEEDDEEGYDVDEEEDEEDEYDEDEDDEEEDALKDGPPKGPGEKFGKAQILDNLEIELLELRNKLKQTETYLDDFAASTDRFAILRGECTNLHELCTLWAFQGKCEADQGEVLLLCPAACQACQPPTGPGKDFGVAQRLTYPGHSVEALEQKLNETEVYMKETIWRDPFYQKVVKLCFDRETHCTVWSLVGECETNPDFMHKNCPASCQECHQLHYETRCPVDPAVFPDIWQPGDLGKMFERVVADEHWNTTVLSRPDYVEGDDEETANYEIGPWIITIDNFITEEEAAHLIEWGGDMGYGRSEEVGGIDRETGESLDGKVSEDRTSTNAWCSGDCDYDDVVVQIFERIEELTGVPPDYSESLQLLRYQDDQFYKTHSDYIPGSGKEPGGPRILTVFMYLNDVEEGGETRFDYFDGEDGEGLFVTPKLGRVVVWPSVRDDKPQKKDWRTEHEAMPVIKGHKFAANGWLHLRDFSKATDMGC